MSTSGGHHEYIVCSVYRDTISTSGDIMIHVVEQKDNSLWFYWKLQCTEHLPMYL